MTHATVLAITAGLAIALASGDAQAQQAPKGREKATEEKREIIIRGKGDGKEKMTIVVDGDNITVNGKPIAEYDGENIIIRKRNIDGLSAPHVYVNPPRVRMHVAPTVPGAGAHGFSFEDRMGREFSSEPRAMLGVTTEKTEQGAKIENVSTESAAAKAGLKPGDIITSVDGKKVDGPQSLLEAVRSHKPEEQVEIGYLRDKKKKSVKVKLGKTEAANGNFFEFRAPEIELEALRELEKMAPELDRQRHHMDQQRRELDRAERELEREHYNLDRTYRFPDAFGRVFEFEEARPSGPKMGIRIQDMENDKGVRITEVEPGSPADKAGLKKEDILTYINGKKIDHTDMARESLREGREKTSLQVTVMRDGKPFNADVQMPRSRKEASL